MNARHAAALALVGWMLMEPRIYDWKTNPHLQPDDPLWRWVNASGFCCSTPETHMFDSKSACEHAAALAHRFGDLKAQKGTNPQARIEGQSEKRAQCISSDDPRLKGKSFWSIWSRLISN